jgi:hypothetical protein
MRKKRHTKKTNNFLDLPTASEGGALFNSQHRLKKIEIQQQKDEQAAHEKACKENEKLQRHFTKESQESERLEQAQNRQ